MGTWRPMQEYEILDAPVTPEQIKRAMFSIPGNKSPGLESYNSLFFKKTWEITGDLVTSSSSWFFLYGEDAEADLYDNYYLDSQHSKRFQNEWI